MSWTQIKAAQADLARVSEASGPLTASWESFVGVVEASRDRPPYHLRTLIETVAEAGRGKAKTDLRILDHGCGGGSALLYLCALGYTGIYGVDLPSGTAGRWNRLLREVYAIQEPRFLGYDGGTLPFADNMFDVVFSQQVLEHVRPAYVDAYYAEEHRVLKPGGVVVHQVPHRLVPYDSHTKTWFLHYLPYRSWRWLLRRIGKGSVTTETALFLRWPWVHRGKIRALFGGYVDLTVDRLVTLDDFSYYDGPVRLRRMIAKLVRWPLIGPLARAMLRNLVMIDTVSRKQA
jgi:SAM-dependent methyltransferase